MAFAASIAIDEGDRLKSYGYLAVLANTTSEDLENKQLLKYGKSAEDADRRHDEKETLKSAVISFALLKSSSVNSFALLPATMQLLKEADRGDIMDLS